MASSSDTKRTARDKKIKMLLAKKEFTRSKAENALREGADPTQSKFTNHRNYHVRLLAWRKNGAVVPEDASAKKNLFDSLTKDTSDSFKEKMKSVLGM